jgi:hypothetical protein
MVDHRAFDREDATPLVNDNKEEWLLVRILDHRISLAFWRCRSYTPVAMEQTCRFGSPIASRIRPKGLEGTEARADAGKKCAAEVSPTLLPKTKHFWYLRPISPAFRVLLCRL